MLHPDRLKEQFEKAREAKEEMDRVVLDFNAQWDTFMSRVLYEALAQRMSVAQIAAACGVSERVIRAMLRDRGLNPNSSKRTLAGQAADALHANAALLGIEPREMNLMSPLAYLPMGEKMRKELEENDERA